MQIELHVTDIAHVIQLSVAPVFLLTGIGALLSVLTTRVSRIVDRTRAIEAELAVAAEPTAGLCRSELANLLRRARFANWAISFCTFCALLICTVIVILFVGAFFSWDTSTAVALLFIVAMAMLIAGLVCFIKEVHLAIASLRIRCQIRYSKEERPPASKKPGKWDRCHEQDGQ